jgi:hypothetical protein
MSDNLPAMATAMDRETLEEQWALYKAEVEKCFDVAQRMDAWNPELSGAWTGTPSERIARQFKATRREP